MNTQTQTGVSADRQRDKLSERHTQTISVSLFLSFVLPRIHVPVSKVSDDMISLKDAGRGLVSVFSLQSSEVLLSEITPGVKREGPETKLLLRRTLSIPALELGSGKLVQH